MTNKVYKSSSFNVEFAGTRSQAMELAREHVRGAGIIGHFTWRADDDSGFTIAAARDGRVYVSLKWNASRNR